MENYKRDLTVCMALLLTSLWLAAELMDDATVKVHFNAAQTDPMAIASAINQASFLVTVQESDANAKNGVTKATGAANQ